MTDTQWLTIYKFLSAFLAGMALLMVICQTLMLWQKERTLRAAWFALMYFSLFVLFLFRSIELHLMAFALAYLFFGLTLVACNFYEWSDFVLFLRQKNALFLGVPDPTKTMTVTHSLDELASPDVHVALEGTAAVAETEKPVPAETV